MDFDDTEKWITAGYANDRNHFMHKSSRAEHSKDDPRFDDAPTPVKSQADMILTEVAEQLEVNATRFDTLKKKLEYMQDLYQNCGTISSVISNSMHTNDRPTSKSNSPRDTVQNPIFFDEKSSEDRRAYGDTQYYDSFMETPKIQHGSQDEHYESPEKLTARSHRRSPRQNIFSDIRDENSSDSGGENSIFEEARSGEKNFDGVERSDNNVADDNLEICRENGITDISSTRQHPYQLHLAEYSKDLQDEWEEETPEAVPAPPEDREINSSDRLESARRREVKRQELVLNLSGSAESAQMMKNKKSKSEKHRKVSGSVTSTNKKGGSKQVYETIGAATRIKRKKRRVKASNSRSTTATRDASISETKRDTKKRRQRDHVTIPASQSSHRLHEATTKVQRNWSEMVEIYHNSALKSGSISVVSSKHSKLEPCSRIAVSTKKCDQRSAIKGGRNLVDDHAKRSRDETDESRSTKQQENRQRLGDEGSRAEARVCDRQLLDVTDHRSGEPNRMKVIFQGECPKTQSDDRMIEEYDYRPRRNNHQYPSHLSSYYDPFAIRSYELPTVASKMKRTLSLIKTRQMTPGGATPFLISRVSKGMRPVSTFLGSIRDRDEAPGEETTIRFGVTSAAVCNVYPQQMMATGDDKIATTSVQLGPFSLRTPTLPCLPDTQTYYEAQQIWGNTKPEENPSAKKRKSQSICSSMKFNPRKNFEGHPKLTQSALLKQRQEELNIGDLQSTRWPSVPQKAKGIREVLVHFHDQFEAMQVKYEKLQERTEKSSDKALMKEMATLEKELNAKEEEINAVVSLYQEVMALKQQMKMLHERNSLVCVATEGPVGSMQAEMSTRANTANPVRMINVCGRSGSDNNRGPSTSTRLAGLLRQIKTFQKQLKSTP